MSIPAKLRQLHQEGSPFPHHRAPTAQVCEDAVRHLTALHGAVKRPAGKARRGPRGPTVLDSLVATILSQNTTNANSSAAMKSLMARFDGDYAAMRRAGAGAIAEAIVRGGLSNVKGKRIKALLDDLQRSRGELSLEYLRGMDDVAAKAELLAYDGVGPKTASCVLLFSLARESFAVDTHVWRIAKRLGWVPQGATRDQTHAHLDVRVPGELKYALHILLIRHGKTCPSCAPNGRPQRAPQGPCPLG